MEVLEIEQRKRRVYIMKETVPELFLELKMQMKIDPQYGHLFINLSTDAYCVLLWPFLCACTKKREISWVSSFSHNDTSPIRLGPHPYMTSFNPNYFLKGHFFNMVTLSRDGWDGDGVLVVVVVRVSTYYFWGNAI